MVLTVAEYDENDEGGLAPGLLIASPSLFDPNFSGSVVLMAEHGEGGALGFIVNRPSQMRVRDVLSGVDEDLVKMARHTDLEAGHVLWGGPVQPQGLWILYRPSLGGLEEGSVQLAEDLALGASRELLESILRGGRSGPFHLLLGYAGWGPKQVEHEAATGSWLPLGLEDDLVFEVPFESRWDTAVRRLGLMPGGFMMGGPGAQA